MKDISELSLRDLQPSQFYISEEKLASVEAWFDPADLSDFEPIPVKLLDGVPVMTDGHTRAVATLRAGLKRVPLVWDEDELDWRLYRACVTACRRRGVVSPADLLGRIIPASEYAEKWDRWCDRLHEDMDAGVVEVVPYTKADIPDVLSFEHRLRTEEADWGWQIDDAYLAQVQKSFEGDMFRDALSFLAYLDGQAVGRIDACLIRSHFDGSTKAYLDWICVIKSYRHRGVAQALLARLRQELKERGVDTLIALTAGSEEAQRFYKHVPDAILRDTGIWIDI